AKVRRSLGLEETDIARTISIREVEEMTPDQVERTFRLLFPSAVQAAQPEVGNGDISTIIRNVLASVLKLREVEDKQSFQSYGLESISAMVLSTRLGKELKLDVQPEWLIEFPTIHSLAAHIRGVWHRAAVQGH